MKVIPFFFLVFVVGGGGGVLFPPWENVCQGTFEDKKILNKKERKQIVSIDIISGFILQRILKNINMRSLYKWSLKNAQLSVSH